MSADANLERHYRRLLAWYPRDFRHAYEDEMIGVAMSASSPEQRRPRFREAVDLVGSGLRTRLRTGLTLRADDAWASAAAAFAFVGAVGVAILSAYSLLQQLAWSARAPLSFGDRPYSHGAIALALGWTLIAAAMASGLRRVAALGAVIGIIGQAVLIGVHYGQSPSATVTQWWRLELAVVAAGAAVLSMRGTTGWLDRVRALPTRATIGIVTAGGLALLAAPMSAWFTSVTNYAHGFVVSRPLLDVSLVGVHPLNGAQLLLLVAAALTVVIVVARLAAPIRRRMVVLLAPIVATAVIVAYGFGGFLAASPQFNPPVRLVASQWIMLIAGPIAVLAVAVLWLNRHEDRQVLIAAGRAAQAKASSS
jgi:hypothetical protein